MSDVEDSEPPSAAVLAGGLGRGNADGLLAVHDAHAADLVGYAEFLLAARPADTGLHPADEAAEAVLDALLAGTVAVAELTDPSRLRAWLLALTRNECLRRRPGATAADGTDEAAELGRRGLRPVEIGALLGYAPAALPRRVPAREAAPIWLRAELAAAGGAAGAGRRAELGRRARPLDQDGFPVPLDRRRLSGRVLAWSAAAVVAVAAGLLVVLPTSGDAAVAGPAGPLPAAASPAGAEPTRSPDDDPLPTLAGTPFGAAASRPADAADRGADRQLPGTDRRVPAAGAAGVPTAAQPRPDTGSGADGGRPAMTLSWTPIDVRCADEWTARLHATASGADVSTVVASVGDDLSVSLRRDGDGWSGDLSGLPTDRSVTVVVRADGGVRRAVDRLSASC